MENNNPEEMAMFRFGLIAPVINETFQENTKTAYYRNVTTEPLTLPDGTKTLYSPSTLAYWEDIYRKKGFQALLSRPRSDKGYSRKLSSEATDAIIALKSQFPKINATMIYERLIEEGIINAKDVSVSTVQRYVKSHVQLGAINPGLKDRKAFEANRVCELWQADTLYGPFIDNGSGKKSRTYLISVIDDKSRLIVASRFFFADNAINFQSVFKAAVLRFGLPEKLFVDNGAPYKNDQLSAICGQLGCVLIHAQPRDGAAKGKIERANRTIRLRFLSVLTKEQSTSLEALNSALTSWLTVYNTTVHSATKMTPMDGYQSGMDIIRIPKSIEWVDECFLNKITRLVKSDATVSISNTSYDVPMHFIGQKVEILFSPESPEDAHVRSEDQIWPIRPTDKQANFKVKRSTSPYMIDYSNKEGDLSYVSTTISTEY
jgi:transposase InsO family protein